MVVGPAGLWPEDDLSWQGPATMVNCRPILSSKRAPHIKNCNCPSEIKICAFISLTSLKKLLKTKACALLSFLTMHTWYFRNSDLHRDLGIETVTDIIAKFAKSHEKRLQDHINIEASKLLNVNNITRRLKQKKPFEVVRR
jgi:hypothetical protein